MFNCLYLYNKIKQIEIMGLSKKQIKDLEKAELFLNKAFELFEKSTNGINWCPVFGQTESALLNANGKIDGFLRMIKYNENKYVKNKIK